MIPRSLSFLFLLLGLAAFGGCASDNPGITPSAGRFYFPTGLALDSTRQTIYVSNSNADLRFNGGTLMALDVSSLPDDLTQVAASVAAGKLGCKSDRIDPARWECDETPFVISNTTVRIGDFPGEVRLSADGSRVFVAARGRTELVWADVVSGAGGGKVRLKCNDDQPSSCAAGATDCPVIDCDAAHAINYSDLLEDTLPSEPFGISYHALRAVHIDAEGRRRTCTDGISTVPCDCGSTPVCSSIDSVSCCQPKPAADHVYLAHLAGGEVSLLLSSDAGVELVHYQGGFFNSRGGIRGGFAIAPSNPGDASSPIFVSSRVDSALASFVVENDRIVRVRRVGIGAVSPGDDVRGIAFGPGGQVLYALDRAPSTLVAIKVRDDDGQPISEPLWTTEVCAEPSVLRLSSDPEDPKTQLAYVVCFADKVIFVIDTETGAVRGRILTGDGPNGLEIDLAHKRAFVANFAEQTVGVVDLDPTHASYRRMILRIGLVELVE